LLILLRRRGTEPADDWELDQRLLGIRQNSAGQPENQCESHPSHSFPSRLTTTLILDRDIPHPAEVLRSIGTFGGDESNLAVPLCPPIVARGGNDPNRIVSATLTARRSLPVFQISRHSQGYSAYLKVANNGSSKSYSIISSAVPRSRGAIVTPSELAVFRLIVSSNFIGFCTGRSPGLEPFRIRSTYDAARRNSSAGSKP
jgi:hypothetical protein